MVRAASKSMDDIFSEWEEDRKASSPPQQPQDLAKLHEFDENFDSNELDRALAEAMPDIAPEQRRKIYSTTQLAMQANKPVTDWMDTVNYEHEKAQKEKLAKIETLATRLMLPSVASLADPDIGGPIAPYVQKGYDLTFNRIPSALAGSEIASQKYQREQGDNATWGGDIKAGASGLWKGLKGDERHNWDEALQSAGMPDKWYTAALGTILDFETNPALKGLMKVAPGAMGGRIKGSALAGGALGYGSAIGEGKPQSEAELKALEDAALWAGADLGLNALGKGAKAIKGAITNKLGKGAIRDVETVVNENILDDVIPTETARAKPGEVIRDVKPLTNLDEGITGKAAIENPISIEQVNGTLPESNRYWQLVAEEIGRLKGESGQGVMNRGVGFTETNGVGKAWGTQSLNPSWYRQLFLENASEKYPAGRKPTNEQLKKLAIENLRNGTTSHYGEKIPANTEFMRIEKELELGKPVPKQWEELQQVIKEIENNTEYAPAEKKAAIAELMAEQEKLLQSEYKVSLGKGAVPTPSQIPTKPLRIPQGNTDVAMSEEPGGIIEAGTGGSGEFKQSQFQTNTLKNAPFLQDPDVQKVLHDVEMMYEVKPNKQSISRAVDMVENDLDNTMLRLYENTDSSISAEDTIADLLILRKFTNQAMESGKAEDYQALNDWAMSARERATGTGQALQAYSVAKWENMTPEGALFEATKVIKKAREDMKLSDPKKMEELDAKTQQVTDELNKANQEVVQTLDFQQAVDDVIEKQGLGEGLGKGKGEGLGEGTGAGPGQGEGLGKGKGEGKGPGLGKGATKSEVTGEGKGKTKEPKEPKEESPAEILAKRVKAAVSSKDAKPDPIKDMIDTLFQVAKQVLPKKGKPAPRNEMELIAQAMKNREGYRQVYSEAQDILKGKYEELLEKHADNPEALEMLDAAIGDLEGFFNDYLTKPYAQKQVDTVVKQGIKTYGVDLKKMIITHYTDVNKTGQTLAQVLVSKAGLTPADAQIVANDISTAFNKLVAERKESALASIFKDKGKKTDKTIIQKIIEYSNMGAFQSAKYRELVAEKLGLPALTAEDAKFITEQMAKYEQMPGATREQLYEKSVVLARVKELIANKEPVNFAEKFKAGLTVSLIANLKTLFTRNPLGNVGMYGLETIKDIPASVVDTMASKALGVDRSVFAPSLGRFGAEAKGAWTGLKEWGKDVSRWVDTSPSRGQYELPQKRIFDNKILEGARRVVAYALQLGDRPFYEAGKAGRLYDLQKAGTKGKTKMTPEEMEESARKYGLERVYQNDSELAKGAMEIRRKVNKMAADKGIGTEDMGVANIVAPFVQTPANIADKAIDYSPIGVLQMISQASKIRKGAFNSEKFANVTGRSLTGTGLMLLGYDLAKNGVITGKPDKDEDVRAYMKEQGINSYSINWDALGRYASTRMPTTPQAGDETATYDWAQPASLIIAIGADYYFGGKDRKSAGEALWNGLLSGGDTFFNQSFLQGVTRMMGGYSPTSGIAETVIKSPTMLIPTTSKQLAQIIDPVTRNTYDPDMLKQVENSLLAKIPGVSSTLHPKITTSGTEAQAYQKGNSIWNVFFNPSFSGEYKPSPGALMVMDIYQQSGETKHFPRVVDEKLSKVELTPQQFEDYQRYVGAKTAEKFNEKANDAKFRSKSPDEQAKALAAEIENINTKAKKDLFGVKKGKWPQ